jgi:hypothetical protein
MSVTLSRPSMVDCSSPTSSDGTEVDVAFMNVFMDAIDAALAAVDNPTNLSAAVPVNKGGTGVANLGAHGVVVGNGTTAVNVTGAGVAGQALLSGGASADPAYGYLDNGICDGRLTLSSGTPVTTADVTGATSILFAPYRGNRIALYDGVSVWNERTFAEISFPLGTLVNGQAYDLFAYDNAGTVTLEMLEWKNAAVTVTIATPGVVTWNGHGLATGQTFIFTTSGALPTGLAANTVYFVTVIDANTFKLSTTQVNVANGTFIATSGSQSGTHTGHMPYARQTALAVQDGRPVKSGAPTRLYLGSFGMASTTTTEDSAAKRLLFNYYNRQRRALHRHETTNSWTYTTATLRQANFAPANQVEVLVGVAEVFMDLEVSVFVQNSTGGVIVTVGIGEDTTTVALSNVIGGDWQATTNYAHARVATRRAPAVGKHVYAWLEQSSAIGVTTWGAIFNTAGSGMNGSIEG